MSRKSSRTRKMGVIGGAVTLLAGIPVAAASAPAPGTTAAMAALLASPGGSMFDGPFQIDSGALKGYTLNPVEDSFKVGSFYGPNVGQPGQPNTFQGTETFIIKDANGDEAGTINAFVSHSVGAQNPNLQILVGEGGGTDNIPQGSVFNFAWSGNTITNSYADLAGGNSLGWHAFGDGSTSYDGGTATNGSIVSWLFNPDYSAHLLAQNALEGENDFQLENGNHLIAIPDTEDITAVTNTSPYAIAVQGISQFAVVNPEGHIVGTFWGNTISTADLVGGHSFEIVPNDDYGVAQIMNSDGVLVDATTADFGTGVAQPPPDGSIFNMLYFGIMRNVYTDYNMGPDQPNEIAQLWTWFGSLSSWAHPTFDAVAGTTDGHTFVDPIYTPFGNITQDGGMIVTGINGMPNGGVNGLTSDTLGIQQFTIDGHSFWADVSDYANGNGTYAQSLFLNPNGTIPQFVQDSIDKGYITSIPSFNYDGLPDGLVSPDGTEIDFTQGSWWSTVQIDTDPLNGGSGDISQYLSIPLFGGEWTEVDPGSDWLLGMLGITF